jgi:hypothetical protein
MKLRLQLAGTLPPTTKLGQADLVGKGGFSTTMQGVMAMLSPAKTSPVGNSQEASPDLQSQTPKKAAICEQEKVGESSAAEGAEVDVVPTGAELAMFFPVVPHSRVAHPKEPPEGQGIQNTSEPLTEEERTAGQIVQALNPGGLVVRTSIAQQHRYLIPERSEQPQSLTGAMTEFSERSKDASSRARHRTGQADGGGSLIGANASFPDLPPVSQSVPVALAVPVPQPSGLEQATSTSNPEKGRIISQGLPRQALVQTVVTSDGESSTGPLTMSEIPTQTHPQQMVAITSEKHPESISARKSERFTIARAVPAMTANIDAKGVMAPNQQHHEQAGAPAPLANNAKQIDPRAAKENVKQIGTEQISQTMGNITSHTTPIPAATQNQSAPGASQIGPDGPHRVIDVYRPQANAAQVLQRMDMAAPSGAVQLRADARRLDVGISSGALGWVEVRATTAASGRVDATLQVQNDSSAHLLATQSREISDYAREHAVHLGELSVGVGTGGNAREGSNSAHSRERDGGNVQDRELRPLRNEEPTYGPADTVSFISIRA